MYDLWLGVNLEDEYRKVIAQLSINSFQTILDVSTGTGAVIFRMVEAHPNATPRFLGVDLSIGMLRVAQRKFIEAGIEVPLFHSKVEALPSPMRPLT
jgi:ubiquinone/menaquinone biosynthesis C-methylase UbiE